MPLSEKDKSKLESLVTQTNTKAKAAIDDPAAEASYYFVCDKSLDHCVILVGYESHIMKAGRKAMLTLKKLGKPLFSQGKVGVVNNNSALLIQKGNAKPTMIKKGLKDPNKLIGSLPGAMGNAAKTWKIMMYSADEAPAVHEVSEEQIADFKSNYASEIAGLSPEEIKELLGTMLDFQAQIPDSNAEKQLLLEEKQARDEEADEIKELEKKIASSRHGDQKALQAMEMELAERKIELSIMHNGEGDSLEVVIGAEIAEDLRFALGAAQFTLLKQLLERVKGISLQINAMQEDIEEPPSEGDGLSAQQDLDFFKRDMQSNLNAIQEILERQSESDSEDS
jgi:hypothetical protein